MHDRRIRRAGDQCGVETGPVAYPENRLDTREKIKTVQGLHSLFAESLWSAFVGAFDPLTADTIDIIERARKRGRKFLVVIRPEPDELLSAESRAVLLAALRFVDAVHVAATNEWRSVLESVSLPVTEEENGRRRREEFAARVEASEAASPRA
jgi:hypothetical protein